MFIKSSANTSIRHSKQIYKSLDIEGQLANTLLPTKACLFVLCFMRN